jgi:hypothetical protein
MNIQEFSDREFFDHTSNHLLYPVVWLASITVVLTVLASLRQPLGPWLPAVAAFGVAGGVWVLYAQQQLGVWWLLAAGVSWTALAVVSRQAWPWPTVSTHPDAWTYWTIATYLTDNVRGVTDNMSLVEQYASHLHATRFASACLLALISYSLGGQSLFMAHTVFYVVCLTTLVLSTGSLCASFGLSLRQSLLAAGATALLGWTMNAIIIGNYDNLLFIALVPAAIGVLVRFHHGALRTGTFGVAGGTLAAALIYTYPEGLALTSVLLLPLGVASIGRLRTERQAWAGYMVAGLLALFLVSPYLSVFVSFLQHQLTLGTASDGVSRPGTGYFLGLLKRGIGPALFALGNEFPGSPVRVYHYFLPVVGSLLAVLGAWRLRVRHPWFPWVLVPFAGLFIWQNVVSRYDYGTYKVLFCMSWWVFPAMVAGGWWLAERWGRPILAMGAAVLLIAGVGLQRWSLRAHRVCPPQTALSAIAELPAIRFITHDQPVLLSVNSDFEQLWAVAFLKSIPLVLEQPRSYLAMPHVLPGLAKARPAPAHNGLWVLCSGPYPDAIWRNQSHALLHNPAAFITAVDNPNDLETLHSQSWVWIAATRPTVFSIRALHPGRYELGASQVVLGPSAPSEPQRTLEVIDAAGTHHMVLDHRRSTIPLSLHAGSNRIAVRSLTLPTVRSLANGDTRELMLGLQGYYVTISPAVSSPTTDQ